MKLNSKEIIKYYDDHAEEFFQNTYMVDMHDLYEPFLKLLPKNARILDVGCGSGRDSQQFLKLGYDVVPFDGSRKMVKLGNNLLGIEILHLRYEDIDFDTEFNGIWACASFVHISGDELQKILSKMERALTEGGILSTSLKNGVGTQIVDGRIFYYHSKDSFSEILSTVPRLRILDLWETSDARCDKKNEKWLNVLLKKKAGG